MFLSFQSWPRLYLRRKRLHFLMLEMQLFKYPNFWKIPELLFGYVWGHDPQFLASHDYACDIIGNKSFWDDPIMTRCIARGNCFVIELKLVCPTSVQQRSPEERPGEHISTDNSWAITSCLSRCRRGWGTTRYLLTDIFLTFTKTRHLARIRCCERQLMTKILTPWTPPLEIGCCWPQDLLLPKLITVPKFHSSTTNGAIS